MAKSLVLGPPVVTPITAGCGVAMRLADSVRHCVVFLGLPGAEPAGTGFLVGIEEDKDVYRYLVTARHVAAPHLADTPFVIRGNLRDGAADEIDVDKADWTCHPDPTVDIAVFPFEMPPQFESAIVLARNFVDEATRKQVRNVGVGSLAYIVGLFHLHSGKERNLPIVHTGHIALESSDERIPVEHRESGKIQQVDGYLVEAHTLEGLSGSPVFVRRSKEIKHGEIGIGMEDSQYYAISDDRPPAGPENFYGRNPVFNVKDTEVTSYWAYGPIFLLGLWQGSWDGDPGTVLAKDRGFKQGKIRVPVGMGIVVPADKIVETLNSPKLKEERRKSREDELRSRAAKMDSAFSEKEAGAAPATDNPSHKEDFTRLLGGAVKANKPVS